MFRKILYPTDFSESAKAALKYVIKLKEAGAEEVVLLHVYDQRDIDLYWEIESMHHETEPIEQVKHEVVKQFVAQNYRKLKELEQEIAHSDFKTELIVEEGIPYQVIVKVAEDLDVSLIVMGTHGEHGFVEKLLGSTTGRVIAHSPVPVLAVKPKQQKKREE